ncbi:MAG: glycoside hydrolase family 15 protein [Bacteroidales bacterium]|nr:glycoside hydrolase family 15 protein [Bacteroidales bacterium]
MDNLNYGIVGNCKSAALISEKGSIDWCCMPNFNSSSVFAKLLDTEKGGSFEILVDDDYLITQSYIKNTNLLVTKFKKGEDQFDLVDFMPRYINGDGKYYSPPDLIRYIKLISGRPIIRVKFDPKLEYAEYRTKITNEKEYVKSFTFGGNYDSLYLYSSVDNKDIINGQVIELEEDQFFLLSYNQKILKQSVYKSYLKMERTKVYWMNWAHRSREYSKFNEEIIRSALTLKLLSYDKSGAVIAAITTSLPETIGEQRNWDYRFCWLRDSSMVVKIMTILGHLNLTKRYISFILDIIPDKDEKIQIMYGINGERKLTEKIIPHFKGYENSGPVRIGNAAYKQKQNDIYGVLMDVIYQQFKMFETSLDNSEELWTITRSIVRIVKHNWRKPDKGIWELRSEPKHFTFSKVLCWVAVDRAIKIAELINRASYISSWRKIAQAIKNNIIENAWNEEIKAFTQAYNEKDLDASILLLESYGFIKASDPKYIRTVKTIQKELSKNGLMYRYKNKDDFGNPKSSFTICSFWLINALYRIGEKSQAEEMFRNILKYSNHLGLFSEGIDFESKRLLGNFPQAYSHLALIESAIVISGGSVTNEEKILEAIQS